MAICESLEYGKFFHIYNRGINSCNLFTESANYEHFLRLYERYIDPVADTFAWVLLRNHFHLLVRIKENICYKYTNADRSPDGHRDDAVRFTCPSDRFQEVKWMTCDLSACIAPDSVKIPKPHLHFSHFFNAYSKYFNNKYNRHGSLFETPFHRKQITHSKYLRQVILYIHNNPVHHGFCDHPLEYPWSSYQTCISVKPTKLQRDKVVGWFDDVANFKYIHQQDVDMGIIENILKI